MAFLKAAERQLLRTKVTEYMTKMVQLKRASTPQEETLRATEAGEILIDIMFGVAYHARYGTIRPPGSPNKGVDPPQE